MAAVECCESTEAHKEAAGFIGRLKDLLARGLPLRPAQPRKQMCHSRYWLLPYRPLEGGFGANHINRFSIKCHFMALSLTWGFEAAIYIPLPSGYELLDQNMFKIGMLGSVSQNTNESR